MKIRAQRRNGHRYDELRHTYTHTPRLAARARIGHFIIGYSSLTTNNGGLVVMVTRRDEACGSELWRRTRAAMPVRIMLNTQMSTFVLKPTNSALRASLPTQLDAIAIVSVRSESHTSPQHKSKLVLHRVLYTRNAICVSLNICVMCA
eukprot:1189777-Prorocentrum_minimum.AAC.4